MFGQVTKIFIPLTLLVLQKTDIVSKKLLHIGLCLDYLISVFEVTMYWHLVKQTQFKVIFKAIQASSCLFL